MFFFLRTHTARCKNEAASGLIYVSTSMKITAWYSFCTCVLVVASGKPVLGGDVFFFFFFCISYLLRGGRGETSLRIHLSSARGFFFSAHICRSSLEPDANNVYAMLPKIV